MTGRPSIFSDELAATICERIARDEGLEAICRDDAMPSTTTVYRWLRENEAFRDDYTRAREDQGHTIADALGDIRKKVLSGELGPKEARAAADIAKWEASRRAPKHYGDKTLIGSDPDNPLPTPGIDASKLSSEALREVLAARDG